MITSIIFDDTRIDLTIEHFKEVSKEDLELNILNSTFAELFCCFSNALLSRGRECWALMNRCNNFFLFDSLGIEVKGKKMLRRRAVLYKFESLDLMIGHLMNILEETFGDDYDAICEISTIHSCPTHFQRTIKEIPPKNVSSKRPCPKKKTVKTWRGDNKIQDLMKLKDVESVCEKAEDKASNCIVTEDLCAN